MPHTKQDAPYDPQKQGERRRPSSNTVDEILTMIRETKDDETRAVLLVLQQLASAAESLVMRIDRQETAFENHLEEYDKQNRELAALINKGVGSWRVIAIGGPALMSLMGAAGFYIMSLHLQSLTKVVSVTETMQSEVFTLRREVDVIKARNELRNELRSELSAEAIRRMPNSPAAPQQRIVVVPAPVPTPAPAPKAAPAPAPTPAPAPEAPKVEKRWWEK